MARRLMYWQVYLHKTSLCAEFLLTRVLERARYCYLNASAPEASPPLRYFLSRNDLNGIAIREKLEMFLQLDDSDIIQGLKSWHSHEDSVLSKMSKMMINRDLPKVKVQDQPFEAEWVEKNISAWRRMAFLLRILNILFFQEPFLTRPMCPKTKKSSSKPRRGS